MALIRRILNGSLVMHLLDDPNQVVCISPDSIFFADHELEGETIPEFPGIIFCHVMFREEDRDLHGLVQKENLTSALFQVPEISVPRAKSWTTLFKNP